MKNVKDFGAVGDGKTLDTKAIQNAIDSGGMVVIPEGTYLTGTLYLKSNGGLYLEPGAKLLASHNREDYNKADYCPQNKIFEAEFMAGTHLITAVNQENIFIGGFGTIDGDSHFWVNEKIKQPGCDFWGHPPKEANRPAQMLFFAECKNVKVENVTLLHSPFWHLFFHGCTDVIARGLTIRGERRQWVNDGIDIDCCSNVAISDCIIDTGDDGITLRANGVRLTEKEAVCENITVSNCVITSYLDYGIRIGVGNGVIRNALFSNVIIKDSLNGIGMTNRFNPHGDCTSIEDIRFSNVSIEAKRAIELKVSCFQTHPPLKMPAYIKNISFNNVFAATQRICYLLGFENADFSGVEFNDSKLVFTQEGKEDKRWQCNDCKGENYDCAFYMNKVRNICFKNFAIDKKDYKNNEFISENVENLTIK